MGYLELIEQTRIIRDVDSCTTTGDPEYPGTALEVYTTDGEEILHVVVDSTGERQVRFLARDHPLRIPLELLEQIIAKAKDVVNSG